jgi:hypothetical protein
LQPCAARHTCTCAAIDIGGDVDNDAALAPALDIPQRTSSAQRTGGVPTRPSSPSSSITSRGPCCPVGCMPTEPTGPTDACQPQRVGLCGVQAWSTRAPSSGSDLPPSVLWQRFHLSDSSWGQYSATTPRNCLHEPFSADSDIPSGHTQSNTLYSNSCGRSASCHGRTPPPIVSSCTWLMVRGRPPADRAPTAAAAAAAATTASETGSGGGQRNPCRGH